MLADGLVTLQSSVGPEETISRLVVEVLARGMSIFCQLDHAAGAAAVGMCLRPTTLLVFGAPKGGTPLMQSVQTSGIDLPLKALVWQDEAGSTFISYNDPTYVARRHGLDKAVGPAVEAMSIAVRAIAEKSSAIR
jgi:uncharacterized protein (DUF302 family)